VPKHLSVFHILHVRNLKLVVESGYLFSDIRLRRSGTEYVNVGYRHIKQKRLSTRIPRSEGLVVGSCVPFYFCPRSPMLYVIGCGNNRDLAYQDGQEPIVHLRFTPHKLAA